MQFVSPASVQRLIAAADEGITFSYLSLLPLFVYATVFSFARKVMNKFWRTFCRGETSRLNQ